MSFESLLIYKLLLILFFFPYKIHNLDFLVYNLGGCLLCEFAQCLESLTDWLDMQIETACLQTFLHVSFFGEFTCSQIITLEGRKMKAK